MCAQMQKSSVLHLNIGLKKLYGNLVLYLLLNVLHYVEQQAEICFSEVYKFMVWLVPSIHNV